MKQRIRVPYIIKRKGMETFPIYLKWKILDYRMVLTNGSMFSASTLHQYSNMEFNSDSHTPLINGKSHHQTVHKFQHSLHSLLVQQMMKYVPYKIQYTRISSIQICQKLKQDIFAVQVM